MARARKLIQDFSTANKIYVNAVVTFYTVLDGQKTNDLANLYSTLTGPQKIANPQILDSYGKFRGPVYIDEAVIMTVTGLGNTPDHDTGIVEPDYYLQGNGSPEGVVTADRGAVYVRLDGGPGATLYVKEDDDGSNTGWSAK